MLRARVYTAIVLVSLIAAVMFALPPVAGQITLAALLAIGAWEWAAFAGFHTIATRLGYVLTSLVLGYLTVHDLQSNGIYQLMLVAAAWWVVAALRIILAHDRVSTGMTLVAGWLTLLPALAAVGHLYVGAVQPASGNGLFLMLLALVAAADIGAYFAGRRFGHTKLAPSVSPGKTWEGVIGGAIAVTLLSLAFASVMGLSKLGFVGIAGIVFVASVVGDLTESLFKRGAGLKDSGFILPGHGGLLDRIDSLTAAAPFYVLGLHWLGILQ